ncbi:MAG: hypothetical protein HC862_27915 [Scytonema sp. RU_4_4]|nr:hypothetical protein [Scytonema sp. RU_4_4]
MVLPETTAIFYLCHDDSFNAQTTCVTIITSSELFRHPLNGIFCLTVACFAPHPIRDVGELKFVLALPDDCNRAIQ